MKRFGQISPVGYAATCASVLRTSLLRFRTPVRMTVPQDRARTVAALEQALAKRGRQAVFSRRLVWTGSITAAAAAMAMLVAGWSWSHRSTGMLAADVPATREHEFTVLGSPLADGAVVTGRGAERLPMTRGMTLQAGTGLVAPAGGEVSFGTTDGTVLTLEQGGELTVVEQAKDQRFSLKRGAVRAKVGKLQPRERFIIATGDAEVEVHGTAFRVAIVAADARCGAGTRTRVSVSEGVVSVRSRTSEAFIPAGSHWPTGCPAPVGVQTVAVADATPVTPASTFTRTTGGTRWQNSTHAGWSSKRSFPGARGVDKAGVRSRMSESGSRRAASSFPASALSAQNDLFEAGLRAKREGRGEDAVRLFTRLVDGYPEGPLTEGAMVQRMTVLRTLDRSQAARVAAEYLHRFPDGYARGDAASILVGAR